MARQRASFAATGFIVDPQAPNPGNAGCRRMTDECRSARPENVSGLTPVGGQRALMRRRALQPDAVMQREPTRGRPQPC